MNCSSTCASECWRKPALRMCDHVCVWLYFTKALIILLFSYPPRRLTGARARESNSPDPDAWSCWANITLPSKFLCACPSPLVSVSLLLSPFPSVPDTEDFFVIQSRKCIQSQICFGSCLISSLLCSCRLPSPSAWPRTASVRHMGTSRTWRRHHVSWCPGCVTTRASRGDA